MKQSEHIAGAGQPGFCGMEHLLTVSVEILGADSGFLRLYDDDEQPMETITYRNGSQEAGWHYAMIPDSCAVSGAAIHLRKQLTVANVSTDCTFKPFAAAYESQGVIAIQSTPLFSSGGKLIGVLSTRFGYPHFPSDSEVRIQKLCMDEALRVFERDCLGQEMRGANGPLQRRNAKLEQANARLLQSNQELRGFVSAASHDLKEPLRVITGYSHLLGQRLGETLDADSASCVSYIAQSAECMGDLLGDLLVFTEIEEGAEDLSIQATDLNEVLQTVMENLGIAVVESGVTLTGENLPTVQAPECHFIQLFQHLIGNAIKYRSDVPLKIHVSARHTGGQLEFAVADNGLGIDPEYHERIFHAFRLLHATDTSGTGVGLSLCKRVVERYGGRIWVESGRGQGTTFRFTLPKVAIVAAQGQAVSGTGSGRTPHIVLVEDNLADVRLLRWSLSSAELDCEITAMEDGEEALRFARQTELIGSQTPDLVILDLHLPKSDGAEILTAMNANPAFNDVSVVVMSSSLSLRDLASVKRFRGAVWIQKPSTLEEAMRIGVMLKDLLAAKASWRPEMVAPENRSSVGTEDEGTRRGDSPRQGPASEKAVRGFASGGVG